MVEDEHHRRDELFEVIDERLVIPTGHYGFSKATGCRLDRPAVELQDRGAGLLRVLDKGVNKCGFADSCNPVQMNYPGAPRQQIVESAQLRCATDEGGPLLGN